MTAFKLEKAHDVAVRHRERTEEGSGQITKNGNRLHVVFLRVTESGEKKGGLFDINNVLYLYDLKQTVSDRKGAGSDSDLNLVFLLCQRNANASQRWSSAAPTFRACASRGRHTTSTPPCVPATRHGPKFHNCVSQTARPATCLPRDVKTQTKSR